MVELEAPTLLALEAREALLVAEIERLKGALQLQESADEAHVNCDECEGEGAPELCPCCFPLFDDARIARRAALSPNPAAPQPVARGSGDHEG